MLNSGSPKAPVIKFNMKKINFVKDILLEAGISVNGPNPWDMQVHDQTLFSRLLSKPSLALGEGYMDEEWSCEDLAGFFDRIFTAKLDERIKGSWRLKFRLLQAMIFNLQNLKRARRVAEAHYNLGNDLFQTMLDPRLVYTCGYWQTAQDLASAQVAKLELVCQKIGLQPGMRVLDIGCGWGSFVQYAAETHGAYVTGVNISIEQLKLAAERCRGLSVEFIEQDYRKITGHYDRVVSLGMFEHVGPRNYRQYMEVVSRVLADDGLFLLHTIGGNTSVETVDPWIEKYIFPGGVLPSIAQIGKSVEKLFVVEDWHNFGPDYAKTLDAWLANFQAGWLQLRAKYGDRFYRMWTFWLQASAAGFRARNQELWQIVLSKGRPGSGYKSSR